jgi:molybdopterin-guanine dinucleotide biosynthesis protein A
MDAVLDCFSGCKAIAVSAVAGSAAESHAKERTLHILYDDPNYPAGPLVGICAGLAWASEQDLDYLATAPCDAPLLSPAIYSRLLEEIGAVSGAYAVTADGEHPLCGVWRVALALPLAETLQSGVHPPVRSFLARHGVARVFFENEGPFANANTPEDLARLERK